jgi:hypothetical protein
MIAIARAVSRVFLSDSDEFDFLKQIALFCLSGLLVSLLALTYGVDLTPGLF